MKHTQSLQLPVYVLRFAARLIISIYALFWLIFALLSGSQDYGGGIRGIIYNSPNAIPWLIMCLITYLCYKKEQIGGGLLIIAGIFTTLFFKTYEDPLVFLIISLPLLITGSMFIFSWYSSRPTSS
jgi:hypothetical protein